MSKVDVTMSEAEVIAFLTSGRDCVLAARTAVGDLVPALGFAELRGQMLQVSVSGHDAAGRALLEDGRVCCIVEESPSYYEIVSVAVRGTATNVRVDGTGMSFDLPVDDVVSTNFAKLPRP